MIAAIWIAIGIGVGVWFVTLGACGSLMRRVEQLEKVLAAHLKQEREDAIMAKKTSLRLGTDW